MSDAGTSYEPRYLGGILCFNEHEFFDAHDVWESLWLENTGPERNFVKGLIHAAVAAYHLGNGNLRGAVKLFHSGRDYMTAYGAHYWGLDVAAFWAQMERCFAEALVATDWRSPPELDEELVPAITLDPPPAQWPDRAAFASDED